MNRFYLPSWLDIPNDVSICICGKKSLACIQQDQRIAPRVFDHDAAADLDVERWNDHPASGLLDECGCFIRRINEQVNFLSLSLCLEHEFCI